MKVKRCALNHSVRKSAGVAHVDQTERLPLSGDVLRPVPASLPGVGCIACTLDGRRMVAAAQRCKPALGRQVAGD